MLKKAHYLLFHYHLPWYLYLTLSLPLHGAIKFVSYIYCCFSSEGPELSYSRRLGFVLPQKTVGVAWCLSSSHSWTGGFSTQNHVVKEHQKVIFICTLYWNKDETTPSWLLTSRWRARPCILSQACDIRGYYFENDTSKPPLALKLWLLTMSSTPSTPLSRFTQEVLIYGSQHKLTTLTNHVKTPFNSCPFGKNVLPTSLSGSGLLSFE